MNPPFPLLALWGNKNWPPSMKLKKLEIFWNKMGSMGCKWSNLNAPGTETTLNNPLSLFSGKWFYLKALFIYASIQLRKFQARRG